MGDNGGIQRMTDRTGGHLEGSTRDDLFESLSHSRRRRCLAYLRAADGAVEIDELATHIATTERSGGKTVTAAERDQVTTSLFHVHLPKLVDTGLVAWVDERSAVRVTTAGQSLSTELSWVQQTDD